LPTLQSIDGGLEVVNWCSLSKTNLVDG
jgi:hypothetical protein